MRFWWYRFFIIGIPLIVALLVWWMLQAQDGGGQGAQAIDGGRSSTDEPGPEVKARLVGAQERGPAPVPSAPAIAPTPPVPATHIAPSRPRDEVSSAVKTVDVPTRQRERSILPLDGGWRFLRQDVRGAFYPTVDDSGWEEVVLPHTWNALDGQDGPAPVNVIASFYRGACWYRRRVPLDQEHAGRRCFLVFDGASMTSEVWVNGQRVGAHAGAFAAFSFDVTAQVKYGEDNLIAVRVDNGINADVAPIGGDFTFFGGIHRPVRLVWTDALHISLTDHGSCGVYLTQHRVDPDRAEIGVLVKVRNDGAEARSATLQVEIIDHAEQVVATKSAPIALGPQEETDARLAIAMTKPRLWNGRADPYLYRARVRLVAGSAVIDEVRQPLGLRWITLDPHHGVMLNGRPYDLHGVCMHQDRLDKGWATSDDDQREDVALVDEMGASFVRLVHYQHPQRVYRELDERGIMAWTEVPCTKQTTNSPAFLANCKQQLRELIRQNYNHPSIICWGLFNSISSVDYQERMIKELQEIAREEDPIRFTVAASTHGATTGVNQIADAASFNVFFGWYLPNFDLYGPWFDTCHAQDPKRCFGLSEYGAGASINQQAEHPQQPSVLMGRDPHPESYQTLFHEAVWRQLATRPFIWCKQVWVMFDHAADKREDGELLGRSDMGLVTIDRKTRKDAFYWYQANWSETPMVRIVGRRLVKRSTNTIDIKVYSNCEAVTLAINGEVQPTRTSTDRCFEWKGVALRPGANAIIATGVAQGDKGKVAVSDTVSWNGP